MSTDNTNTSALARLWISTADLYARFGVRPTPESTRRVFREECGEVCDVSASIQTLEDINNYGVDLDAALEALPRELVDALVTGISLALAHQIAYDDFVDAIDAVIAKNDAKTTATHAVDAAGKIARKAVQS